MHGRKKLYQELLLKSIWFKMYINPNLSPLCMRKFSQNTMARVIILCKRLILLRDHSFERWDSGIQIDRQAGHPVGTALEGQRRRR